MELDEEADVIEEGSFTRPYLLTGGRTRSEAGELAIEAMIAVSAGSSAPADRDLAAIYALCETPNSIAEISAKCSIPLGVARVLVADLWGEGTLEVLETTRSDDIAIVRRLLDGIRNR
ncbi:MAG: DUF742 domain-containing protein [Acidimicrobiia bacterium]|nr:DUF742 domain-containing protein [Acidimicrobiia bacterium]